MINLDYINPLSETSKLELGLESRIQNTKNKLVTSISNGDSSFSYDRNIFSGYVTYSKRWNEKWNTQIGTRIEQYDVDALFFGYDAAIGTYRSESYKDNIFSIYPSAFLTYSPNTNHTFKENVVFL